MRRLLCRRILTSSERMDPILENAIRNAAMHTWHSELKNPDSTDSKHAAAIRDLAKNGATAEELLAAANEPIVLTAEDMERLGLRLVMVAKPPKEE